MSPSATIVSSAVLLLGLSMSASVLAAKKKPPSRWALLPVVNYNTDDGFGAGLTGSYFWHAKHVRPYRARLRARFFVATPDPVGALSANKLLHAHLLSLDMPRLDRFASRVTVMLGLFGLASANYCGTGNDVTCSASVAAHRLRDRFPDVTADADEARRYYKLRYFRPTARLFYRARPWGDDGPEPFVSWRGSWYRPGTLADPTPYPNSLYAERFPDGESGLVSIVQLGIGLDRRDNEPAPTEGYWLQASVRHSATWLGADYSFIGFNATARGYYPLASSLIVAGRFVADGVTGDLPVGELSRVDGTFLYAAYGGVYAGRGIRVGRYLGPVKVFTQAELRWTPLLTTILGSKLDVGLTGFLDAGVVGLSAGDLRDNLTTPRIGTGLGLRAALNTNFVVRADVGASPLEGWTPRLYLALGHVF